MRPIDADAMKEWLDEYLSVFKKYDKSEVKGFVDHAPTIEPKRGEWIKDTSSPIAYRCTACNTLQHWSVIQDGRYHFCPNCGADMREVRDE